jgi:hypothetical protein
MCFLSSWSISSPCYLFFSSSAASCKYYFFFYICILISFSRIIITRRKQAVPNHPDQHLHKSCHLQPPLAQHPCNHHYKQTSPQPPLQECDSHSVFTVEMGSRNIPRASLYKDSEPIYQEIRGRIKHSSDGGENMLDRDVRDKLCDQQLNYNERDKYLKTCDKPNLITNPVRCIQAKPSIVYGVITAKEVAKYRPCTQDIILRP